MSLGAKMIVGAVTLLGTAGVAAGTSGQTYKVVEMPAGKGEARAVAIDWNSRILVNLDKPTGQTVSLLCTKDACTKLEPKGKSVSYWAMQSNGVHASYAGSAKHGDADWAIRQDAGGATEKLVKGTARGIDHDGRTVIGETAAGRAFYFDDSLHFLPTLGGERSIATSIFDGWVAGASQTAQGVMHATLYSIGGELVDIGVLPGGDSSIAYSVRGGTDYVGGCSNDVPGSSAMRPVLFQTGIGVVSRLSSMYGPRTQGCVLSNHGYDSMVGWVMKPSASETRAAIHRGSWRDLNEVVRAEDRNAYTLLVSNDVNPYGQIAATARRHSDGASVAVLVTPIP